ncbi:MAG TPA: ATP-binding protein [Candidatus Binatia bacterium]|nr:ATP-binding protein [Candidatus Binatia bacterium]
MLSKFRLALLKLLRTKSLRSHTEAVAHTREQFERIAATTPDFLFVYDLIDRRILYANPRVEEQLGRTVAEVERLEADPTDLFVHPDDLAHVREQYRRFETSLEGEVLEWQQRGVHVDGTHRWFHVRATVFERTADRRVRSVIGYSRDITKQKQLETEREELLAMAEQSRAEAEKVNRTKDEFLATLGHELRNPLGVISTSVQLLRRKGPPEPVLQELRDTIERQVEHIARLIDDLLDVSRISRGKILLDKKPCNLTGIVSTTLEDYRVQLEEADLHLVLDLPDRPVWATADRTRVAQIAGNLLHNAIKFTEPGGYVTVRLAENTDAKVAVLTVRDTGIGIEPHLVTGLFEPFVQAECSIERSRGGLGLGLALVKGLVELHGGTVEGSSEGRGEGSEFTVRLPLGSAPGASVERVTAPDRPGTAPCRILIVEDNLAEAGNLEKFFTENGHTVEVAQTGPEGIQAARRFKPEVVLCDIGLPGLDGYGVARAVRQDPDVKQAYLIAVTGYGRSEDAQRALEAGFDTHLMKPIDLNKLEAFIGKSNSRKIVDPLESEPKQIN